MVITFLALVLGFHGPLWTRTPYFGIALAAVVYALALVDATYPFVGAIAEADLRAYLADVLFAPALVFVLATFTSLALVKVVSLGQLVDVWLTGSGGGTPVARVGGEETNVPSMLAGTSLIALALVLWRASVAGFFAFGLIAAPAHTLLAAVLVFGLGVLLVGSTVLYYFRGARFLGTHDIMSVYYFACAFLLITVDVIFVRDAASSAAFHIVTSELLLLLAFALGNWAERARARSAETAGLYRGRFSSLESRGVQTAVRGAALMLGYGLVLGLGHLARAAGGTELDAACYMTWPLLIALALLVIVWVLLELLALARSPPAEPTLEPARARLVGAGGDLENMESRSRAPTRASYALHLASTAPGMETRRRTPFALTVPR